MNQNYSRGYNAPQLGGGNVSSGVGGVFGGAQQNGAYGYNNQPSFSASDVDKVLQKIRDSLAKRGNRTIRSIGKAFRTWDGPDSNRRLDYDEFAVGLREHGVNLTQQENQIATKYFDRDGNGSIDYDEFLIAIRGRPNKIRQDVIDRAFKLMDRDNSGQIDRNDLLSVYDVSKHPKFNNGKSPVQIQDELLENFGDVNKDGKIVKQVKQIKNKNKNPSNYQEWDDYYAAVSSSIDNDEHFVLLMERAWKMKK